MYESLDRLQVKTRWYLFHYSYLKRSPYKPQFGANSSHPWDVKIVFYEESAPVYTVPDSFYLALSRADSGKRQLVFTVYSVRRINWK